MKPRIHVFVVIGALALTALVTAHAAQNSPRVVRVSAERFAFTPSEIPMTVDEEIEIRLKSDDTSHGFRLIGQDVDITIPKRGQGEAIVKFKGSKAGKYEFECSHLCGAGHSFMRGVIVVKSRLTTASEPRERAARTERGSEGPAREREGGTAGAKPPGSWKERK